MTIELGQRKASTTASVDIRRTASELAAKGRASVLLSRLSIPPVKGPLNAFRVADEVDIVFDLSFDAAAP
jgi:hypothetical protein